ncbi:MULTISPECIES: oxygen-dependent coproporphyrinogen oxidase [Candidatus Ichthyocystis]|uniref:coproporphyrinogen oxidase n=1 Tax=Candidatus Ichthyocystis hellenicum TaxID=1561003 RepID=A0A0S4M2R3_9BURK|nr:MULTISPECIES: oxygen-dependent coproporphyrinogen oxidase [Ichthyocystis]CUT18067.1 Coproporphyrinogen-III oxidase [Candidatus Ichthyocystis hellenicum]
MLSIQNVQNHFKIIHDHLVTSFEKLGQCVAKRDSWVRVEGGGGESCVFEKSNIFERGGVNFSSVYGESLPSSATVFREHLAGQQFFATGVSLVIHPWNPYVPTVHLNVRFFCTVSSSILLSENREFIDDNSNSVTWWIGGGMDMTPYYGFFEDAQHFHRSCRKILLPFGENLYPLFKKNCDEYFFLKHRKEARGIGGIFFDDFNSLGLKDSLRLVDDIGRGFFDAYSVIVNRRSDYAYNDRERRFQLYRRGRYVEFNLLWDRGTTFGLQSNGRTESILISMPPLASWEYDWKPLPGSPEDELYSIFLKPREWV